MHLHLDGATTSTVYTFQLPAYSCVLLAKQEVWFHPLGEQKKQQAEICGRSRCPYGCITTAMGARELPQSHHNPGLLSTFEKESVHLEKQSSTLRLGLGSKFLKKPLQPIFFLHRGMRSKNQLVTWGGQLFSYHPTEQWCNLIRQCNQRPTAPWERGSEAELRRVGNLGQECSLQLPSYLHTHSHSHTHFVSCSLLEKSIHWDLFLKSTL